MRLLDLRTGGSYWLKAKKLLLKNGLRKQIHLLFKCYMDLFVYTYIVEGVIVFLSILKTIHFIKNKNRNWKPFHWVYFSNYNIKNSTGADRVKLKQTQNRFSISILILLFVLIILQVLSKL